MKSFVVIGLGRFGMAIARELAKLGHEVIAIDRDEAKINEIADEVTHAMSGDIHDEGVLRRMGVAECDCAVVAFATSLQDNILVTLLLKELGVKRVIAKARSEMDPFLCFLSTDFSTQWCPCLCGLLLIWSWLCRLLSP